MTNTIKTLARHARPVPPTNAAFYKPLTVGEALLQARQGGAQRLLARVHADLRRQRVCR